MNRYRTPTVPHFSWVCFACLAFACVATDAHALQAKDSSPVNSVVAVSMVQEPAPVLASFWDNIMGNRRRMIQVGLVAVCLGFLLLSWSRK
jgi:hypothetical protein